MKSRIGNLNAQHKSMSNHGQALVEAASMMVALVMLLALILRRLLKVQINRSRIFPILLIASAFANSLLPAYSAPVDRSPPHIAPSKGKKTLPHKIANAKGKISLRPQTESSPPVSGTWVPGSVTYIEDPVLGTLTTIDADGVEYVFDKKHHIAFIRKAGVIVDSLKCEGASSTCNGDESAASADGKGHESRIAGSSGAR